VTPAWHCGACRGCAPRGEALRGQVRQVKARIFSEKRQNVAWPVVALHVGAGIGRAMLGKDLEKRQYIMLSLARTGGAGYGGSRQRKVLTNIH
jgi:hypothetical protein